MEHTDVSNSSEPIKLSFALKKTTLRAKYDVQIKEEVKTQYIKGVYGDKVELVDGETDVPKEKVIARLENTLIIKRKETPIPIDDGNLPVTADDDKFIKAAPTAPVVTEYGLQLRDKPISKGVVESGVPSSSTTQDQEDRVFKASLTELPDVCSLEEYEEMPVEDFGKALLRGLGWKEGHGIGRNKSEIVPIQYVKRPERLGLGAQPISFGSTTNPTAAAGKSVSVMSSSSTSAFGGRSGNGMAALPPATAPRRDEMVVATSDGRPRNTYTLDEKLVHRSQMLPGPRVGKVMRIVAGVHRGLRCRVVEVGESGGREREGREREGRERETESTKVRVRVFPSEEEVYVAAEELDERDAKVLSDEREERGREGREREEKGREERGRQEEDAEEKRGAKREREEGGGSRAEGGGGEDGKREQERKRGSEKEREGVRVEGRERGRSEHVDAGRGREGGVEREGERERGAERERDSKRGKYSAAERHGEKDRETDRKHQRKEADREVNRRNESERGKERGREKEKEKGREKEKESVKEPGRNGEREKYSNEKSLRGSSQNDLIRGSNDRSRDSVKSTWLMSHIRVKVVDRKVCEGRLYLKKGRVLDVHPGRMADVFIEDTAKVIRLHEDMLETVVPKQAGSSVMIVSGPRRGERARVLECRTADGVAAVQVVSDFAIVPMVLDDLAEFVGAALDSDDE